MKIQAISNNFSINNVSNKNKVAVTNSTGITNDTFIKSTSFKGYNNIYKRVLNQDIRRYDEAINVFWELFNSALAAGVKTHPCTDFIINSLKEMSFHSLLVSMSNYTLHPQEEEMKKYTKLALEYHSLPEDQRTNLIKDSNGAVLLKYTSDYRDLKDALFNNLERQEPVIEFSNPELPTTGISFRTDKDFDLGLDMNPYNFSDYICKCFYSGGGLKMDLKGWNGENKVTYYNKDGSIPGFKSYLAFLGLKLY